MTPEEIARVAKGLSEAQRRAVLSGNQPSGAGKWPVQNTLVRKGLAQPFPWRWTDLGLALRAFLEAEGR